MKRKTYLLEILKDDEVVSTIVLKNLRAWRLDIEAKYNDIVDAFRNDEISNFEVSCYKPFYKLAFRKWNKDEHKYVEYAYLYKFEINEIK